MKRPLLPWFTLVGAAVLAVRVIWASQALVFVPPLESFSSPVPQDAPESTTDQSQSQHLPREMTVLPDEQTKAGSTPTVAVVGNQTDNDNIPVRGMGACLIMKDDNHWLIEWLAYHYHVLPLKHLVYLIDPESRTAAKTEEILHRYDGLMTMEAWNDTRALPERYRKEHEETKREMRDFNRTEESEEDYQEIVLDVVKIHRRRQKYFYARCLKHFKKQMKRLKVDFLILTDVDEFLHFNPQVIPREWKREGFSNDTLMRSRGSVEKALRLHQQDRGEPQTCHYVPRIQMTVKESPESTIWNGTEGSLPWLNRSDLLTSRWRNHNGKEIRQTGDNTNGKNIFDLRALKLGDIPIAATTVHYIISDICLETEKTTPDLLAHPDSWLRIFHYAGTLEQYTFREDPRDSLKRRPQRTKWYEKFGNQSGN